MPPKEKTAAVADNGSSDDESSYTSDKGEAEGGAAKAAAAPAQAAVADDASSSSVATESVPEADKKEEAKDANPTRTRTPNKKKARSRSRGKARKKKKGKRDKSAPDEDAAASAAAVKPGKKRKTTEERSPDEITARRRKRTRTTSESSEESPERAALAKATCKLAAKSTLLLRNTAPPAGPPRRRSERQSPPRSRRRDQEEEPAVAARASSPEGNFLLANITISGAASLDEVAHMLINTSSHVATVLLEQSTRVDILLMLHRSYTFEAGLNAVADEDDDEPYMRLAFQLHEEKIVLHVTPTMYVIGHRHHVASIKSDLLVYDNGVGRYTSLSIHRRDAAAVAVGMICACPTWGEEWPRQFRKDVAHAVEDYKNRFLSGYFGTSSGSILKLARDVGSAAGPFYQAWHFGGGLWVHPCYIMLIGAPKDRALASHSHSSTTNYVTKNLIRDLVSYRAICNDNNAIRLLWYLYEAARRHY